MKQPSRQNFRTAPRSAGWNLPTLVPASVINQRENLSALPDEEMGPALHTDWSPTSVACPDEMEAAERECVSCSRQRPARLAVVCYVLIGASIPFSGALLLDHSIVAVYLLAAGLLGFSEADGRCGTSHIQTFDFLFGLPDRTLWIKALSAYTVFGLVTAGITGAALGAMALT